MVVPLMTGRSKGRDQTRDMVLHVRNWECGYNPTPENLLLYYGTSRAHGGGPWKRLIPT
jgi:hypothetical protein